ncbi:heterokaryon incompatibility, partial [Aulographum hederae CBS 113979]
FHAVSYVWGDPKPEKVILVNDHLFAITWNLAVALIRLTRTAYVPLRLWVDAVCINQQDIDERSSQVQLMSQIYRRAEQVTCCLGETGGAMRDVIKVISEINKTLHASATPGEIYDWLRHFPKIWTDDKYGGFWPKLYVVLNLEYWNRVWVIQEMVFALN